MNNQAHDEGFGPHQESDRTAELRSKLLDEDRCERMSILASAFADANRVRLISLLARGPECVGNIAIILGRSQSAVSHQLKLLKSIGLVRSTREGKHIYYSLVTEAAGELLRTLETASELSGDTP
ncbi:MAG: metalloregulator ArsR/SmtB family transcription factor [Spirochaetia bacterium]